MQPRLAINMPNYQCVPDHENYSKLPSLGTSVNWREVMCVFLFQKVFFIYYFSKTIQILQIALETVKKKYSSFRDIFEKHGFLDLLMTDP